MCPTDFRVLLKSNHTLNNYSIIHESRYCHRKVNARSSQRKAMYSWNIHKEAKGKILKGEDRRAVKGARSEKQGRQKEIMTIQGLTRCGLRDPRAHPCGSHALEHMSKASARESYSLISPSANS